MFQGNSQLADQVGTNTEIVKGFQTFSVFLSVTHQNKKQNKTKKRKKKKLKSFAEFLNVVSLMTLNWMQSQWNL